MGFRYLKSTIKTKIIFQKNNILMSLTFLKIISRCIKFNMNILYCDETSIQNQSNNIQTWRKSNEVIYEDIPKKEKLNLILTVSKDDVIYFELNEDNTNQDNFLIYKKNLLEAIKKKLISEKFVIVLDNYSGHKTPKLMEYYLNNKINVLFNSPYLSNFNAVELAFRNLKKAAMDISINEPIETDKNGNILTLMDTIAADESVVDKIDTKINIQKLKKYIHKYLTPREKAIICMRYGLCNKKPMPQREVAKILGISRSYVSRIEKKVIEILKKHFEK